MQICIDQPNEYIVSISGTYGNVDTHEIVRSICFKTNQNLYGPYGNNTGTVFAHDVKGEVIIGFHGRAESYIHAIGVYVMPKALASASNPTNNGKIMNEVFFCCLQKYLACIPVLVTFFTTFFIVINNLLLKAYHFFVHVDWYSKYFMISVAMFFFV